MAAGSDGQIYVVGGNNGSYLKTVEAYQPPTVTGASTGVTATAGTSFASVSWTPPGATEGMPVTGYTITCATTCTPVAVGGSTTSTTGHSGTSCTGKSAPPGISISGNTPIDTGKSRYFIVRRPTRPSGEILLSRMRRRASRHAPS